ncbi:hypothetical protein AVEN_169234-1, partial [Araneus ventricosus]
MQITLHLRHPMKGYVLHRRVPNTPVKVVAASA